MEKNEIWDLLKKKKKMKAQGELVGDAAREMEARLIVCKEDVLKSNDAMLILAYSESLGSALIEKSRFVDALIATENSNCIWQFLLNCKESIIAEVEGAEEKLLRAYDAAQQNEEKAREERWS